MHPSFSQKLRNAHALLALQQAGKATRVPAEPTMQQDHVPYLQSFEALKAEETLRLSVEVNETLRL